jgi:hypothetical protein
MKFHYQGPSVDLSVQIALVIGFQGCSVYQINDSEGRSQGEAQVPVGAILPHPDPPVNLNV